jgi:predicted MPP superfamily phosphohydrolase
MKKWKTSKESIMDNDGHMSRRSFLKQAGLAIGGLSLAGIGTSVHAFFFERFWYEIRQVKLEFPNLPAAFSGMRILQFSDIHLGHFFDNERLAAVIERLGSLYADLICFTGDLFDVNIGNDSERTTSQLATLEAPLGKWACLGNHDYWAGSSPVTRILEKADFQVLNNASQTIRRGGETIRIAGIDDWLKGKPNLDLAVGGPPDSEFTLLLAHEPDIADLTQRYPVDLQLSGHSHGGQISLPVISSFAAPPKGRKYIAGLYEFPGSGLKLYTNRGIGTTIIPFRLFCRPEITVFTLVRTV